MLTNAQKIKAKSFLNRPVLTREPEDAGAVAGAIWVDMKKPVPFPQPIYPGICEFMEDRRVRQRLAPAVIRGAALKGSSHINEAII